MKFLVVALIGLASISASAAENKKAKRAPASVKSGQAICGSIGQDNFFNDAGVQDFINANCNLAKFVSITTDGGFQGVCCVKK